MFFQFLADGGELLIDDGGLLEHKPRSCNQKLHTDTQCALLHPFKMMRKIIQLSICISFFVLFSLSLPNLGVAGKEVNRFFLMGSGSLHLENLRNAQEASVHLLNQDGSLSEKALDEVDRVFGFPTQEKMEHISPRLLFILSYFSDHIAPGRTINIQSGYRSPSYNSKIRKRGANAAKTSTHIDGMALDFWIEGMEGKYLWETIRAKNCCGVGHYGDRSIHLDAGRPRFWQAATSGTRDKTPDYNRHIYLSSDFDRYAPEEVMRLSLSGISTFGFGVKPTVYVYRPADLENPVAQITIKTQAKDACILMSDRITSRFLYASLPSELPAGRYRMKMEVCRKPFDQMPSAFLSNEIELVR